MGDALMVVDGVSAGYGENSVLKEVSLEIGAGEKVALIGPNGAGKTTLLRCLIGLHVPTAGVVTLRGRPVSEYGRRQLASEIAYVPQSAEPDLPFTVREVVTMGRYPHLSAFTTVRPRDREAVEGALEMMDLGALGDRGFGALSGGERQRAMVAAALAQEARILVLDEPGAYLDPHHQMQMMRLLMKVSAESQTALVWVTHDINLAALCSDRMLALCDGRVRACGSPDEVMQPELLDGLYGHAFRYVEHPDVALRMVVPTVVA